MQRLVAWYLSFLSLVLSSSALAEPGWTERNKIASIETAANANSVWSWIRMAGVTEYSTCRAEEESWKNASGYALNETIRASARTEIMTLALAAFLAGKDVQFSSRRMARSTSAASYASGCLD